MAYKFAYVIFFVYLCSRFRKNINVLKKRPKRLKSVMSESKYESKVTSAPCSAEQIYRVLSNMQNIERVRDLIPKDKIQEMEVEPDRIRMKVDGLAQKISIVVVDRKENDTIKFGAEGIPMDANFWIQLKELSPTDTRIKLTVKADIPFMFKLMLEKKMPQGLDQAADMLAQFPYGQWG